MPKRIYTPDEKKLVRRLLLIHSGNVPIVHHLTGFPKRTIHNWREQWDDDYELYTDALAQNLISRANALAASQQAAIAGAVSDSASAQNENSLAQFAQIRANLMQHATTLSNNLALGDDHVNQRVHALTRLLDRVLDLDELLGDQQPQQEINFGYEYGDQIFDKPPWDQFDMSTKEGYMAYAEFYLKDSLRSWNRLQLMQRGADPSTLEDELDANLADLREILGYEVQPFDENWGKRD